LYQHIRRILKIHGKILKDIKELKEYVESIRKDKTKISFCQGHFNVIHPGHLRFLEFAKSKADYLIVAVQDKELLESFVRDNFYSTDERLKGVASIEFVDKVMILKEGGFKQVIGVVKPDFYIMGEEYSAKTEKIKDDVDLVERYGGKVVFSSGEIRYTSSEYLDKDIANIAEERKEKIRSAIDRQKIDISKLLDCIDSFKNSRLLTIGDTIVDQYVACDALGMSSEAPVLVLQEIESKEYVGGSAIVARDVRALGSKCSFISLVGIDEPAVKVREELKKEEIDFLLLEDEDRQTTFKIRYMAGPQKILRVSRLKDFYMDKQKEELVIKYLENMADCIDGIIVSDFGYGVITPRILDFISEVSQKNDIKLMGDSQTSSQIGDVLKFNGYHLITPSEKEARVALGDKYSGLEVIGHELMRRTNVENVVLTLGSKGFITFKRTGNKFVQTQHFPSLNPFPADEVGAGDSLLSGMAVSICSGSTIMEASVIGAVVAALAVSRIGNVPVTIDEVRNFINTL